MVTLPSGVFRSVLFWRTIVFVLLLILVRTFFPPEYRLDLIFKGNFPKTTYAELYHSSYLPNFDAATRTGTYRVEMADGVRVFAHLSSTKPFKFIRFDPVIGALPFDIEWVDIRNEFGLLHYVGDVFAQKVFRFQQLERRRSTTGTLSLQAVGPDSQIIFSVPHEIGDFSSAVMLRYWGRLLLVCGIFLVLLELIRHWSRRPPAVWVGANQLLARIGRYFSDEATLILSTSAMWVYVLLVASFGSWIALDLHQSSIGVWDNMHVTTVHQSSISVGTPRVIRSDEWNTFTPWMLSQVQNGMQIDNPNLGAPASAVLTGAPVAGPLLLAQPKYWGFALFGINAGFSWFWAFKIFGMLAAVFSLLLLLTKSDVLVSLGGAIAIYGSSLVQWWFSGIAPELLIGFSISVVGSVYLLRSSKRGGMLFGAILVGMVIPNLLMHIYPPHLLPLAYLAFFTVCGFLWNSKTVEYFKYRVGWRLFCCLLTVVLWVSFGGLWWSVAKDTIDLMLNTAYPGKRFLLGGDLDLAYVFHGIFESWRVDDWPLPFMPTNQTAASQMWVLFPLALVLIQGRDWLAAHHRISLVLMAYCLMVVTWASFPLPFGARSLMAYAGWFLVPPWNALIGLGMASMMLTCILVAGVASQRMVFIAWPRYTLPLTTTAVVGVYGMYLQSLDPDFFVTARVVLVAMFLGIFAWTVHEGRRWWFFGLCVLSAMPGLQVNPIRNDLQAYLGKDLFVQAKMAGGKADDTWAVFGDTDIAQGLKSIGLTVVNGSHYAPRLSFLNILDPQHRYTNTWNRYAHVGFSSGNPGASPVFKLIFADQYDVSLDVCGKEMAAMGVNRVVYTYEPSEAERRCLVPVPLPISDGRVGIYTLKSS